MKSNVPKSVVLFVALAIFLPLLQPSALAQTATTTATSTVITDQAATQRQALEAQLAELEKEIEQNQQTIAQYQKQGTTLKNEIAKLNAQIAQINLKIKAVTLSITKLNGQIADAQAQINHTENNIETHKEAISVFIRTLYEADQQSLIGILLANNHLSDFFGNITNTTLVQQNLRTALEEIVKLRQQLLDQKQELASEKSDAENLRVIQQAQKNGVVTVQQQKSTLLTETKGKESEYQKLLKRTQETAAQIRARIFELLGGGELTFEKAYQYAKLAEGATGVRAALILAILNRESFLGKNVGRCSYRTAMNPKDIPTFLAILQKLSIDPNSITAYVSCPNSNGVYGGAMGPAQFIPSTWKLYETEIASVTKNNPPSPWNNANAFVATALYIQDLLNSSSCKNYASQNQNAAPYQTLQERCAAAMYYAGGGWYKYRFWYGDPVVTQANAYEKDIAILKANA